jgi:transcriptional regulator with XRE-family HTH domain
MPSEPKSQPDAGIGERLTAARRRVGWTREELAFQAGLSWPAVAQIESGRRTHPRPATLSALAETLGVTIDYLVRGAPGDAPMLEHVALVYRDEDEFASSVTPFVTEGIERSEAVMVVTRPANMELVRGGLGRSERRVEFVDSASWYAEPAVTLAAYRDYASAKLEGGAQWVRVVGEPSWTGKTAAEARQWGRYESLINLAFASWPVTVLCPYDERSLQPKILRQARATHPETLAEGVPSACRDYVPPDGFVLGAGA